MQQQHKQRLIGAVVVVALAVIFLPMLLQGPVERGTTDLSMEIPPRPEVERGPEEGAGDASAGDALEAVPLPEESDQAAAAPETGDAPPPEPDEDGSPAVDTEAAETESEPQPEAERVDDAADDDDPLASWAVQVGSFSRQDNALGLRERLREQDFSAYVERVEREDADPMYRLRVGPVVEREDAQELLERLADEADLDGLVVSHP